MQLPWENIDKRMWYSPWQLQLDGRYVVEARIWVWDLGLGFPAQVRLLKEVSRPLIAEVIVPPSPVAVSWRVWDSVMGTASESVAPLQ